MRLSLRFAMAVMMVRLCGAQQSPARVIRISGGVMAAQVLTKVTPVYPPEARSAHIQGAVDMHAVIERDGTVHSLTALTGNDLLRKAAVEAVGQWTYKPYLLNGVPVAVETVITVNFQLGVRDAEPAGAGNGKADSTVQAPASEPQAKRVRITPELAQQGLVTKVQPTYPPDAKAKGVQGVVRLRVIISRDGTVEQAIPMDGPAELRDSAVEAVRQWVYKPYTVNGSAVGADTVASVTFTLGG